MLDYLLKKLVFNAVVESPFRAIIVQILKNCARMNIFIPLWVKYISSKLIPIDEKDEKDEKNNGEKYIRILVLNYDRWLPDLNVLKAHSEVCLIALPFKYQAFLNALSVNNLVKEGSKRNFEENVLHANPFSYLHCFLSAFIKKNRIDCIISCAFHYRADQSWQIASGSSNVPFIVLQKEITVDDGSTEYVTEMFRKRLSFRGNKLLVNTSSAREVFIEAGSCESKDIVVTGHLKIDSIYRKTKEKTKSQTKKQIVVFSFLPSVVSGLGLALKVKGYRHPYDRHKGFSKLFEQVHCAMAEIAVKNPDIVVVIKCKWLGKWEEMVNDAIATESSLYVDDIPNLIVTDGPAYKYMEESRVVISFSSTSTIESRLYRRPVIIPFFAEAAGKYKRYVYFKKYFDDFVIATSKEDLKRKVLQYTANELKAPPLSNEMIKEYITYFDGSICDRVVSEIKKSIT